MTTLRRWTWILVLAIIGAFEFTLLLPIAAVYSSSLWIPPWYARWFVLTTVAGVSFALLRLAMDPIRIHATQFPYILRYPPVWVSIVGALLLAPATELLPVDVRPVRASLRWWECGVGFMVAGIVLVAAVRLPRAGVRKNAPNEPSQDGISEFERGEGPIETPQQDRLGHIDVAERITVRLRSEVNQSIALLGPFGSGKTSILNLVQQWPEAAGKPKLWFVQVNCWGLENSAVVPAYILERLVETVERFVDCQHLRGIPTAYRRTMKAEPSGRLRQILESFDNKDPISALRTLTPMLRCLNVKIVVLIEDADRIGRDFDPQHIQRLLWNLRMIERITFVVAADPQMPFDVAKLCDHIEFVPRVEATTVKTLISNLRDKNRARYSFIDSAPDREDLLRLQTIGDDTLERIMTASHGGGIADAIASILDTPRKLRHVERRVTSAWEALHGEIFLDDLLILCVLREGAPDVFNFIIQNMDSARQESKTEFDRRPKEVKAAWDTLVTTHPHGERVRTLVSVLGFPQLSGEGRPEHPQGIASIEPSDYLRRALSERVDPQEIRDQSVLTDIVNYREQHSDEMVRQLASTWDHSAYVQLWEHFSGLIAARDLLPIAAAIIDSRRPHIHASEKDEPLLAVWRRANRRLDRSDEHTQWLSEQIALTLPLSLAYAHNLYYFWASQQYGIVTQAGRQTARRAMHVTAQLTFTTGSALRTAMSPHEIWDLRHLVQAVDHQEPLSILIAPADWSWIALPVIAALTEDVSIADHVAALIMNPSAYVDHEGTGSQRTKYTLDEPRTLGIFGDRVPALLSALRASRSDSPITIEAVSQLAPLAERGRATTNES